MHVATTAAAILPAAIFPAVDAVPFAAVFPAADAVPFAAAFPAAEVLLFAAVFPAIVEALRSFFQNNCFYFFSCHTKCRLCCHDLLIGTQ